MRNKNNLSINAVLNIFNTLLTISFSFITYPYASRVLGAENLGKVNFSQSIVSYFALIAALGFNSYAIREGGRIRDDRNKVSTFASQIFSLNFVTMIIAFILLGITLFLVPTFKPYVVLILVQSITMISAWISVTWINVVFEDYLFITVRSILTQVLSIALLFLFVNNKEDYLLYAGLVILAHFIPALINYRYSKKYCRIQITRKLEVKKHLPPIILFFSNTIAVSIYLNSDVTMIGVMMNDVSVGLYSVAVKIYSAIRTVIAAMYNVAIPRMANYAGKEDWKSFRNLLNRILNIIIFISIPVSCVSVCVAKDMILFLSGNEYMSATDALSILSLAYIWAIVGGFLAYCIAIPLKKERIVLFATITSAVENIGLNLLLIPTLGIDGAAITTLLSEATVTAVLFIKLRDSWEYFEFKGIVPNCIKTIIASIPIIILYRLTIPNIHYVFSDIIIAILSALCFIIVNLILKNKLCFEVLRSIKNKQNKN